MLTNYCGLWKERPDREFALFIKFIISHKRRQIGHIFIWLFFIIFRRTINSHSQWVPQVTKHPVYHYTIVFNNCLNSYYFPSNWKIAKIKTPKKGKEGINPSNYWPISLLSNISKIFGTIINDSINSFCTDNSIISETQFGFRYKHSTIHGNNHKIYIRHMLDKKMCEDGFITPIQARSIIDLGTRNQQMFTELVLSSKSSQVHYWLRSPRVSNRPYRISPEFSQGPLKQSIDVKSYIYPKPNDEQSILVRLLTKSISLVSAPLSL